MAPRSLGPLAAPLSFPESPRGCGWGVSLRYITLTGVVISDGFELIYKPIRRFVREGRGKGIEDAIECVSAFFNSACHSHLLIDVIILKHVKMVLRHMFNDVYSALAI